MSVHPLLRSSAHPVGPNPAQLIWRRVESRCNLSTLGTVLSGVMQTEARTAPSQPPGPPSDFEGFVLASGPRLKRLTFLLTGNVHAAEDLLQTSYAKAFAQWDRIARTDDPHAYMRQVVVNTHRSLWRRLRNREISTDAVPEPSARAARPGSGDPAAQVEAQQVLLDALRALPDRQRTTVVLRYYCDLSEAEVAQLMNCSVGTVKSNASRGLTALRIELGVPFTGRSTTIGEGQP